VAHSHVAFSQTSRLGKHINELRRKAVDNNLASRAKNLVKKWRRLLVTPAPAANNAANNAAESAAAVGDQQDLSNDHGRSQTTAAAAKRLNGHRQITTAGNNAASPALAPAKPVQPNSSLPSSASTSPGLSTSRPNTPAVSPKFGGGVSSLGVADVTPAAVLGGSGSLGAPRNSAANKRLRKDEPEEEPPAKRPALTNGHSQFLAENEDTRDSAISLPLVDQTNNGAVAAASPVTPAAVSCRRKTRRSMEKGTDVLEQQMQSFHKGESSSCLNRPTLTQTSLFAVRKGAASKVRTTQEILQELASRSQSPGLPPSKAEVASRAGLAANETKSELMQRFFESQNDLTEESATALPASNGITPAPSALPSPAASGRTRTPEEDKSEEEGEVGEPKVIQSPAEAIAEAMNKLPLISASEVISAWSDVEEDEEEEDDGPEMEGLIPVKRDSRPEQQEVTPEMVDRLHVDHVEHCNGNFDYMGDFHEWHEMLAVESLGGEMLHVLPYSIIE